ncbi:twin arginine-targeting protein translocase TatC [Helicobacter sp. 12S02634-8]|uniref:twin-arginine translocase subunit TatC n=1 Tax=Helicobacter sp. 12S02634-8 TaxID=1476199 RepID=UPI000BA71B53|nr:twin-arginine translocase subunit TatC [Helicobacter sp. 12S02634-8]PAF48140.1 twin arginine-targeting protein translocase TatC [Helicobacter sp. 12S02634-8]
MFEDLKPHIQDLRKRLMISVATLLVAFLVCFSFWTHIFEWIKAPLNAAFSSQQVKGMLVQISPAEGVIVAMKVSFFAALAISVPVIFWQLWLFVAPGLYKNEKKVVLPFVFFGTFMFVIGAGFAYYVVFPFTIKYILMFGNEMFEANISASSYVTFFTRLVIGFGIAFELPVLAYFLAKIGLITDATLKHYFKYAIVIIFILAAIITPPDVISQVFMALPLIGLYLLSILIAKIVNPAPKPSKESSPKSSEEKTQE